MLLNQSNSFLSLACHMHPSRAHIEMITRNNENFLSFLSSTWTATHSQRLIIAALECETIFLFRSTSGWMPEGNKNACAGNWSSRRSETSRLSHRNKLQIFDSLLLLLLRVADIRASSLLWKHLNPQKIVNDDCVILVTSHQLGFDNDIPLLLVLFDEWLSSADADWFGFNFCAFRASLNSLRSNRSAA